MDVALVLYTSRSAVRPAAQDKRNVITIESAIDALKPANICAVVTHCDQTQQQLDDYQLIVNGKPVIVNGKPKTIGGAMNYFTKLFGFYPNVPQPPRENVFIFRGIDGDGGPATTTKEINSWLKSILPRAK